MDAAPVREDFGSLRKKPACEVRQTSPARIDSTPSGSVGEADIGPFRFGVFNPTLPMSGPIGDPVNDNPLLLDSTLGIVASNGSAGTFDATEEINGEQMLIQFLVPPFSSNGAFLVFDLATGNGSLCLFFATAGCMPGATEAVKFEGSFSRIPEPSVASLLGTALLCRLLGRRRVR